MIECNTPTEHFSSGCALLKHYDADNDGVISMMELQQAIADKNAGTITEAELTFVSDAWKHAAINAMCSGCYTPSKSLWLWLGAALIGLYLYLKGK